MSIEKVYDSVAKHYNQQLSASVLTQANQCAFEFIRQHITQLSSILALGIGDGVYIKPYKRHYPQAELAGLDISANMLAQAKKVLGCKTYHGDIAQAGHLIQDKKFDLITAHFVCAYVKPHIILAEATKLLNEGGHISFVSNTLCSFPHLKSMYQHYVATNTVMAKKLKQHFQSTLGDVFVPTSTQALAQCLAEGGFRVIQQETLTLPVCFEDIDEFHDFYMEGGWFASGLVHPWLPAKLIKFLFKQLAKRYLTFPFKDTLNIAVVTAKKVIDDLP